MPFQVYYPQGIEMLSIFKNYVARTSILDDFEFYENRQKVMQEKKVRQHMPISNAQVWFFHFYFLRKHLAII